MRLVAIIAALGSLVITGTASTLRELPRDVAAPFVASPSDYFCSDHTKWAVRAKEDFGKPDRADCLTLAKALSDMNTTQSYELPKLADYRQMGRVGTCRIQLRSKVEGNETLLLTNWDLYAIINWISGRRGDFFGVTYGHMPCNTTLREMEWLVDHAW